MRTRTKHGKPRQPRPVVVEQIREIQSWLSWMRAAWSTGLWVHMDPSEREARGTTAYKRKAEYDELPENDPQRWAQLHKAMTQVVDQAEALRRYAYEQYAEASQRLIERQRNT